MGKTRKKRRINIADIPIRLEFKVKRGDTTMHKGTDRVDRAFDKLAEFCLDGLNINSKKVKRKRER